MVFPQCLTGERAAAKSFLDSFDTFLLDCDGVLWSGSKTLPGVVETIEYLKSKGKQVIFVTNNSTKSRSEHKLHFHKMGILCNQDQIFTSAYSTAIYLSQILKLPSRRNKVFVLGERGIEAELDSLGIPHIGGSDSSFDRVMKPEDFDDIASEKTIDKSVGAVVVGMDMNVNYLKLSYAAHYLRRDAVFLATNTDSTYPTSGTVFPGAGCISAALMPMVRLAPLSLGKPSHAMIQAIRSRYELDLERCCMVGDRLDTDIKLGIDGGLGGTLLVLTGVSQLEDLQAAVPETVPSAYAEKLSDLCVE